MSEQAHTAEDDAPATRLSVNINSDCAEYLHSLRAQGITATEVVRQALSLHKCVRDGGRVTPPTTTEPSA